MQVHIHAVMQSFLFRFTLLVEIKDAPLVKTTEHNAELRSMNYCLCKKNSYGAVIFVSTIHKAAHMKGTAGSRLHDKFRQTSFTIFCSVHSAWHQDTFLIPTTYNSGGPGSSVGIVSDYGLDGPGSNPGGHEISRPALGPTQPPVQRVPDLSRG